MSVTRLKQLKKFPRAGSAVSIAAIVAMPMVAMLSACAPAKRLPYAEIQVSHTTPNLSISRDIDMVRLEGVLQTQEQASRVVMQASDLFDASMVIDNITIDSTVASADWIGSLLATAGHMKEVDDFSVTAVNGQLLVGGSVDSAEQAESLAGLASDLAGLDLAVTSNLAYPPSPYEQIDLAAELGVVLPTPAEPVEIVERPAVALSELFIADELVAEIPETATEAAAFEVATSEVANPEVVTAEALTNEAATIEVAASPLPTADLFTSEPTIEAAGVEVAKPVITPAEPDLPEVTAPELAAAEVAAVEPAITPISTTLQSVPVAIEVAVNEPAVNEPVFEMQTNVDTDGDGIADSVDQCTTRPGYPVNSDGCQVLERYLDNIGFTDGAATILPGSESELDDIAMLMQSHPAAKIAVITHALDATEARNAEARQRAFLVTSYLEDRGVERGRVYSFALAPAIGVGDKVLIKEID